MVVRTAKCANSSRRAQVKGPLDANAIDRKRTECMREIERLRSAMGSTPFIEKANQLLLPRYWAGANWRARAEILRTVEWLLGMGLNAGVARSDQRPV